MCARLMKRHTPELEINRCFVGLRRRSSGTRIYVVMQRGKGEGLVYKGLVFEISRYRDFVRSAMLLGEYRKRAY
jgi:hypothetical protein